MRTLGPCDCFSKVPITFGARKLFCVCGVCIQDQSFNNFENRTMKLSVNEAILIGSWARNCGTIQQVLILKFAFGPEKFPGLSRNGPLVLMFICEDLVLAHRHRARIIALGTTKKRVFTLVQIRTPTPCPVTKCERDPSILHCLQCNFHGRVSSPCFSFVLIGVHRSNEKITLPTSIKPLLRVTCVGKPSMWLDK